MSGALINHATDVFATWKNDICNLNHRQTKFVSVNIPARLIVFAWEYAKLQASELKQRIGNSINYFSCVENIFVNKLAELGYVLYIGFSKEDILHGQSPVKLNYKGKDERFCIAGSCYKQNDLPLTISGAKRFCYPTIRRRSVSPQTIIYIDANPISIENKNFSRINIVNNTIKITIIGIANAEDMNLFQDQKRFLGYSNAHTAFTGLKNLTPVSKGSADLDAAMFIPSFVSSIANATNDSINKTVQNINKEITRATDVRPVGIIDYEKLFESVLKAERVIVK